MVKGLPKKYIKQYGISKKAWKEYRKTKAKRKKSAPSKSKSKKGGNRMARGLNLTNTFFKVAQMASLVAPAYAYYQARASPTSNKLMRTVTALGGINTAGKFDWSLLAQMYLPFIAVSAMKVLIPKVSSLIRRFKPW